MINNFFASIVLWWSKYKVRRFFTDRWEWVGVDTLAIKFCCMPSTRLATVLGELVEEKFLVGAYQVLRPGLGFIGRPFDDPRDIPTELFDSKSNKMISTADLDVIPVFQRN